MTKTEEQAIQTLKILKEDKYILKNLKSRIKAYEESDDNSECGYVLSQYEQEAIDIVLNLLEKQRKEIQKNNKYKLYYKEVNKKYIPKDRLKILKKKIKQYSKEANKQIEESVVIADNDSLNYGRMQAHETDISLIDKMLEE